MTEHSKPDPVPERVHPTANAAIHPLDHDEDGHKGGSKPKLVWIVTSEEGIHQVPTSHVDGKISHGKGRRATDRDLAVAGVTS